MDDEPLNLSKNDRSGNGNGLELSERRKNITSFHEKATKSRHDTFAETISYHLLLVGTRNLVELVRFRHRLGGVDNMPVAHMHLFQWRTREKVHGGTKSGCGL